jgi:hypothetical protein
LIQVNHFLGLPYMIEEIFTDFWKDLKNKTKAEVNAISKNEAEPIIKRTIAKAMVLYFITGDFQYIEKALGAARNPEDQIEWQDLENVTTKKTPVKKRTSRASKSKV